MTRLSAAVLATAAAAASTFAGIEVSAAADAAVRAEVVVAVEGHTLDVRRIRVVDGLLPGRSYRLPAIGIRNRRGVPTTFRLVAFSGGVRRWLRFVPARVVIDTGGSRAVGLRLELPDDAEPGVYAVVLSVHPGGPEGARLTFRVEPSRRSGWRRQTTNLALWVVPVLAGGILVVVRARVGA